MFIRNTVIFVLLFLSFFAIQERKNLVTFIKETTTLLSSDTVGILSLIREKPSPSLQDEYNTLLLRARDREYDMVIDTIRTKISASSGSVSPDWYELLGDALALRDEHMPNEGGKNKFQESITSYQSAEALEKNIKRQRKIDILMSLGSEESKKTEPSTSSTGSASGAKIGKPTLDESTRINIQEAKIKLQDYRENPIHYVRFPGDIPDDDATLEDIWKNLGGETSSGTLEDW